MEVCMPDQAVYTLDFAEIHMSDLALVGGKNASLGEMFNTLRAKGVGVIDGFATTASAYWKLLEHENLRVRLQSIFASLDVENADDLAACGHAARAAVLETAIPQEIQQAVLGAYDRLCERMGGVVEVAVRSSATAEDLPEASFAGAAETYLNIRGKEALIRAVHDCYASLFTDRAISYRAKLGCDQLKVALSVGIMPMIRSDKASSGVIFTLDPESGFRDVVTVTSSYGLGEYVVQGVVTPDEWCVFKPTLSQEHRAIIGRRLGTKEVRLVYGDGNRTTRSEATPPDLRAKFSLTDDEVLQLAGWACIVEEHYSSIAHHAQPMDMEWAKDGVSGQLFIVQARPETVHSAKPRVAAADVYRLHETDAPVLVRGQAVGEKVGAGIVHVVHDPSELASVHQGEVLVARTTDPDWEPVMRRVAAIVTDQGGRTAHAAIVSREFGVPCIVGAGNATAVLHTGETVTVSCCEGAEGHVYAGRVPFDIDRIDASNVPSTKTQIMLTVADPGKTGGK